ncbi:MAG: hypothetical protein IKA87_04085, partial [Lentisphaeria bacterium]|nr:hypothetical protein [Lentisphaeria bacterium]
MKISKFLLAALMLASVLTVSQLQAAEAVATTDQEKGAIILKPLEKLSRGISNVAFGVLEVPIQMQYV